MAAIMKEVKIAAAFSTMTLAALLLICSLEFAQGQAVDTASGTKVNVTINTNMTVNVHAKVPGSDTIFEQKINPGTTVLSIPVPDGTDVSTLSFPMQISVEPMAILGINVTGAANSTVTVVANSVVQIQGYLTQIMNAILGLVTVYFKMIISLVPSVVQVPGVAVPPVTVPIPKAPAVPGVPPSWRV